MSDDRTVHATLPSGDLGSLAEAVRLATAPGSVPHLGLPGGKLFDAAVRRVGSR